MFKKVGYVLFILVLVTSLTGCGFVDSFKKGFNEGLNKNLSKSTVATTDKVIKSDQGDIQLTVKSDWNEAKNLNEIASLQVDNPIKEKYAMVISESTKDFSGNISVDDFAKLVKESFSKSVKANTITDFENVTVDGKPAKFFEIKGEVNNLNICYFIVAVKDNKALYQVIGWTLNSKYDENKEEIKKVVESFKEN